MEEGVDSKLLFLVEMFPELSNSILLDLINKHSSVSVDTLVDMCLALTPSQEENRMREAESESGEMISLHPPSIESGRKRNFSQEEEDSSKQNAQNINNNEVKFISAETSVEKSIATKALDLISKQASHPEWKKAVKVLHKIVSNILEEPRQEKFRVLHLANPSLQSKVFSVIPNAHLFLQELGFCLLSDSGQDSLVLYDREAHLTVLNEISHLLANLLNPAVVNVTTPVVHKTAFPPAPAPNPALTSRERLAQSVERRLRGEVVTEGRIRAGHVTDFQASSKLQAQIANVRKEKHRKWYTSAGGRKRVFSVADLESLRSKDLETRGKFVGTANKSGGSEMVKIGQEALKLTNEFRAKHSLPALVWNQTLCDIGYEHSRNMGEGKVSFSHVGFDKRVKAYPFAHRTAAENLAMNWGVPESQVARVAVEGWIDSPGHRKNLLGHHTLCGIAVYCGTRGYFLTQLFALT